MYTYTNTHTHTHARTHPHTHTHTHTCADMHAHTHTCADMHAHTHTHTHTHTLHIPEKRLHMIINCNVSSDDTAPSAGTFTPQSGPKVSPNVKSPEECFALFFDDSLLDYIVDCTNEYAQKIAAKELTVPCTEIGDL